MPTASANVSNLDNIPLPRIGQSLRSAYGVGASHGKIYRAISSGAVIATRGVTGWFLPQSELPALAAHLGIRGQSSLKLRLDCPLNTTIDTKATK